MIGYIQKFIPRKFWKIYTKNLCTKYGTIKNKKILILFTDLYKIDLSKSEKCKDIKDVNNIQGKKKCVELFKDLNDLFTRKRINIKIQKKAYISSPADCLFNFYPSMKEVERPGLRIKSHKFHLEDMLNKDKYLIDKFSEASIMIFYISPKDYHRFHFPINEMKMIDIIPIMGDFYSVSPKATRIIHVYDKNKRAIVEFSSDEYIMILVGATCVGSMVITAKMRKKYSRGDELGYFQFGGSTVILLVNGLTASQKVKMKKLDNRNLVVGQKIV